MRTQKTSQWLVRLFTAVAILALFFTQSVGVASAQDSNPARPSGKEKVVSGPVSIDEVLSFANRLGAANGPVGIVVEFKDKPAAVIFAQYTAPSGQLELQAQADAAQATQNQINTIAQKQNSFMSVLQNAGIQATEIFRAQKTYNGIWMKVDMKDLKKIAALPGIKAIHPIITKELDHTTSVPLIGAPQVWGGLGNVQGAGIKIGIIDSGVDYIHANFGGDANYSGQDFTTLSEAGNAFPNSKVVGGWDFAGDDYDANPNNVTYNPIPAPDADPMDCGGHGSHVAGTAAGYGVNENGTTYIESGLDTYSALRTLTPSAYADKFLIGPGVAPKADIYSLRVFGCAGSTDIVVEALDWAMDPNGDGNFMDHLDVVNMSLGSPFGTPGDADAVASDNAVLAGVIVSASAGNSNDVYYVTGSPAVSGRTLSVASSVDASAVLSAFEINSNSAASPLAPAGAYPASLASFGPQSFDFNGNLAKFSDGDNGCAAYPAGTFTGKIALINRGTCTFVVKVKNAQNAGATGVLMANNTNAFPAGMGGTDATITIPSMMTTQAIGTAIKADMNAGGTVNVRLTTALADTAYMTDPTVVDTVSTFSSRGPARDGTSLKPDIAAPGDSIFSTANGTGNKGANFSGTSMAAPHMAGVMALLRQIHPTWSVADLKALAMNTATNDLYTGLNKTGTKHTPTRIGAGRVSVSNAALSPVIAYNTTNPELVSLSFGDQAVLGVQTFTKSITIKNTDVVPAEYLVSFVNQYQANPGLTFTLLDSSNAPLAKTVTVAAGSTLNIKLQITADAAALTRGRDGTIATTIVYSRQRFAEGGGYVLLTSTVHPNLRVPVQIAARPASDMQVTEGSISLPATATGTFSLTPSGTPVDTVDDTSVVSVFELLGTSADDPSSTGTANAADLMYVGATSDYPFYTFATSGIGFGIATYGKWDTLNAGATEFDIYIDTDEDGIDDWVAWNASYGSATGGSTDDVAITEFCSLHGLGCSFDYFTNLFSGSTNTNFFNNNVASLWVGPTSIGLDEATNTDFNFYVVSWSREYAGPVDISDLMSYDLAHQAYTTTSPDTGEPVWLDASLYSPTFDFEFDKSGINANHLKGLLLLHHFNTTANSAEVIPLQSFVDVPTNAFGWDYIERLYAYGVTSGCTSNPLNYCPAKNITRAQMAIYILRAEHGGSYVPPTASGTMFTDVPAGSFAADWIEQLATEGITSGCGGGNFCPSNNISRVQMAILLVKATHGSGFVPAPATGIFTDVPVGSFGADYIEQLYNDGVTSGCGGGNFCPSGTVTRAQMAILVVKAFKLP